ncbi:MAG: hypothetical protein JSV19_02420 [Phycisphaerales bacterium]|nr:MAG: hypothetical protein JSV19_02420 [Phycisphaerales bacterium]
MKDTSGGKASSPRRRRARCWWAPILAAGIAWTWVPIVLAQQPVKEPSPSKPVFQWLFAIGMTLLCCAIAFKNPKRSHMG